MHSVHFIKDENVHKAQDHNKNQLKSFLNRQII